MKIVKVSIQNFLKLKDVEFNPSQANVIIGRNKQGKTSILKAIKAAFDGKVDEGMIHAGEDKAEIIIDLEDLHIKRTITDKGNYLDIANEQGFKVPSPQKYLNNLIGTFSFNPVEFYDMKPLDRKKALLNAISLSITEEELVAVTGEKLPLDYTKHALEVVEDARKIFYDRRTIANAEVSKKRKSLDDTSSKLPEGFNPSDVSEEHIAKLRETIQHDEMVQVKQKEHERFLAGLKQREVDLQSDIAALKAQLAEKEATLLETQREIVGAVEFEFDVSDEETIRLAKETLAKLESQREHLFTHRRIEELRTELNTAVAEATKLNSIVDALTKDVPQSLVAKANVPVEGLSFTDDNIMVNGVLLDNLSSSEQLRFAVQIAKKLNDNFKIICCDGVEMLDRESFTEFLQEFENDQFQLFVTRVDNGEVMKKEYIYVEGGSIRAESTSEAGEQDADNQPR